MMQKYSIEQLQRLINQILYSGIAVNLVIVLYLQFFGMPGTIGRAVILIIVLVWMLGFSYLLMIIGFRKAEKDKRN